MKYDGVSLLIIYEKTQPYGRVFIVIVFKLRNATVSVKVTVYP